MIRCVYRFLLSLSHVNLFPFSGSIAMVSQTTVSRATPFRLHRLCVGRIIVPCADFIFTFHMLPTSEGHNLIMQTSGHLFLERSKDVFLLNHKSSTSMFGVWVRNFPLVVNCGRYSSVHRFQEWSSRSVSPMLTVCQILLCERGFDTL